ncbi:23S rRNA (cytosine1962-C5)-methyltransferase [Rhodobium orientis]|nr:class I SAM-dependent methyltransferase [Rhodobium orientis]MBB4302038.1 23S rRNA (cytosine1962-C5)-methyltransferase [Rhodobium orientis]
MLTSDGWSDYALLDMGDGEKLERYGSLTIVRPEPQAMGSRRLGDAVWEAADAVFTGDTDEEGPGRWKFSKKLPETWPMRYGGIGFVGRFTSFRHVGLFPEQDAHWRWMAEKIRGAGRPVKVLNLFGYTGLASLVAAEAGAQVTHVDASKKAIGWARENQALSGLEEKPIRWICDDATKFVAREGRRGNTYDGILLDPPKYGRGPKGEVWQLFENLPEMVRLCREILAPDALFLVLTAYSIRASFLATHELLAEELSGRSGTVESGELALIEQGLDGSGGGRALSTSMFSRWSGQ